VIVRTAGPADREAIDHFLVALPQQDGGFLKANLSNRTERDQVLNQPRGARLVAVEHDGTIVGYAAVLPSAGRSRHVAELRLVVAPGSRRQGIGRALARSSLIAALELKLEKLAVEVLAGQDDLVDMFLDLGFEAEALLHDFVRDENGCYADLMVLVHPATEAARAIAAAGIDEEVS
jgi:predicted GNAT family N-acyltransferase